MRKITIGFFFGIALFVLYACGSKNTENNGTNVAPSPSSSPQPSPTPTACQKTALIFTAPWDTTGMALLQSLAPQTKCVSIYVETDAKNDGNPAQASDLAAYSALPYPVQADPWMYKTYLKYYQGPNAYLPATVVVDISGNSVHTFLQETMTSKEIMGYLN